MWRLTVTRIANLFKFTVPSVSTGQNLYVANPDLINREVNSGQINLLLAKRVSFNEEALRSLLPSTVQGD
jgi:hypothetical protein